MSLDFTIYSILLHLLTQIRSDIELLCLYASPLSHSHHNTLNVPFMYCNLELIVGCLSFDRCAWLELLLWCFSRIMHGVISNRVTAFSMIRLNSFNTSHFTSLQWTEGSKTANYLKQKSSKTYSLNDTLGCPQPETIPYKFKVSSPFGDWRAKKDTRFLFLN